MSKQNPYANFTTNQDEEIAGVFVNYGSFRVKVARAGGSNRAYIQAQDRKARAMRRMGTPTASRMQEVLMELVAETCVKAWEIKDEQGRWVPGMFDPASGEVIPFNVENVKNVFSQLPNLAQAIQGEASSMELFQSEDLEGEAGN